MGCIEILLFYKNVFYIIELQSNRLLMEEHIKDYFFSRKGLEHACFKKKQERNKADDISSQLYC